MPFFPRTIKIYNAPFPCKYDQKRVTTDALNVKSKLKAKMSKIINAKSKQR